LETKVLNLLVAQSPYIVSSFKCSSREN